MGKLMGMPKLSTPLVPKLAANNTVKLTAVLQRRVATAMQIEGFTVWSEFCRVALTEKCHVTEDHLRARDPVEFQRIYPNVSPAVAKIIVRRR
jgi:hypothetical protein